DKVDRLHAQLDALPGVNVAIEGFLGERVHEILGGETAPIAVDVIGPELEQLRSRSAAIAEQIRGLAGVRSVTVEAQVDVAELRVRPDPVALAPFGLLPADVVEQVRTWRLGHRVADLLEPDGRIVGVVVVGDAAVRARGALADLLITTASGRAVQLSTIAHIDD